MHLYKCVYIYPIIKVIDAVGIRVTYPAFRSSPDENFHGTQMNDESAKAHSRVSRICSSKNMERDFVPFRRLSFRSFLHTIREKPRSERCSSAHFSNKLFIPNPARFIKHRADCVLPFQNSTVTRYVVIISPEFFEQNTQI